MHGQQGLTTVRRGSPGHGERFLLSAALLVVSLLWFTRDMALWANILCVVGAAGGALGMLLFGRNYMNSRRN
ncbi:hypothetical protein [Streptomyces kanamyceticus]|uniref:Uncharacterized protein n=1 Tax=Streptomyces kanamyceticus TaxID=1967 RepID=A0A5J6GGG1_STRKN|nr:hypothetical protein [Streptomyces kanamyceticus]QEU93512.1 hypothetical protein CP970_23725 [Streptomyces kanamyceticus]